MSGGRFQFRLQRLLELRRLHEQETARQVAHALRAAEDARAAVARLGTARAEGAAELTGCGTVRTAGELQRAQLLLGQLDEHIAVAETVCESAESAMAESVAEYNTAARMRQVLDRLRDRQRDSWRITSQQSEQKELDEIAVLRHNSAAAEAEA